MKAKKKFILFLVAALLAAVVAISGLNKMRGIKATTAEAEIGMIDDYYSEEGRLTFGQKYTMIAKVSGSVKKVHVRENDQVKKGDILFEIDDRDIQYEKARYDSDLEGLRAKLEQSKINQLLTTSPQEYLNMAKGEMDTKSADFQSAKTVCEANNVLYADGDVSKLEWEQSKASYELAKAAWQQSQERYNQSQELLTKLSESGIDQTTINIRFYDSAIQALESEIESNVTAVSQLEEKLKDCVAKADRDGTVISIPIMEMSSIQAGSSAVVLSSHEHVQVQAEVLTSIAPYLKVGDTVVITLKLRGGDISYNGKIRQVYSYASKGTSSLGLDEYRVPVKVELDQYPELEAMDGYDVTIWFLLYRGVDKLWVPSSSVFRTDNQDFVFKIEGGKAIKQLVEVEYQTSTQAVIISGIEEGDSVISNVDKEGIYDGVKVYR